MMREILFRGKRKDGGIWLFGDLRQWSKTRKGICDYALKNTSEVDPKTVGQFTGLTDKNGKKIFEGDVVAQNWYDHDEPADSSFGEVVFCEYDCSFSVMDIEKDGIVPLGRCHAYHWEAEVIGNIHDNPELLEGGVGECV